MEEGTYRVTESARTYFYRNMSVRIEGAEMILRSKGVLGFQDEVINSDGNTVTVHAGWVGVSQEGDDEHPTQIKVEDGRIPQDARIPV